jgi:hypothetical protein
MFDVFYFTEKPNIFVHERKIDDIEQAFVLSRTRYFWIVDYLCDYREFDFLWEPPPWQSHQRHAWSSQWQPDSGTYLMSKSGYVDTNYHQNLIIPRLPDLTAWIIPDNIDQTTFDWSWHPNPSEPDFEYHFGTQWHRAGGPVYPGSAGVKFCDQQVATSVPRSDHWYVPDGIDPDSVDHSWHPNPLDPPYIYHFPSQHQPVSGVTYSVPGATDANILIDPTVKSLPRPDHWHVPDDIVAFDYSWHPNPLDPPYIHEFGTQWYDEGGPVYRMLDAREHKYHDLPRGLLAASQDNWYRLHDIDEASFDWSWRPHPKDPAYIYVWGNQHWPAEKMPTVEYRVPGATERKFMLGGPRLIASHDHWVIPDTIDPATVDHTWRPDPMDPPFVYEFGTQWQKTGGACYAVPGAVDRKYMEKVHHRLPAPDFCWESLEPIRDFDYSWHPDSTEEPYIYVFGNQHYPGTIMPTVRYRVPGAIKEKFLDFPVATLDGSRANWEILESIAEDEWDWSWRPNPLDPPYIYVFGNQWNAPQHRASVRYQVPGATEIKYMETRTRRLGHPELFDTRLLVEEFDYSWEPNPFDPPMTYVFGNQWNPAVLEPTVIYSTGGHEFKYMDSLVAIVAQDRSNWEDLDDIETFDYSWRPNPMDPPYIYVFGNQWLSPQQRPALRYRVPGASEIKYITEPRASRKSRPDLFVVHYDCEFDYSWEPDPESPPYIYVFGNQWWPAEKMPTVEYAMPGATERKFMSEPMAKLLPKQDAWRAMTHHAFEFDQSWVPDPGSPPYIYVFGNQWWPAQQMSTIEYHVKDATERKYLDEPKARILPNRDLWNVPEEINDGDIDYSWIPDPNEPPYIYHFSTEYQVSVGLTYTVPGAADIKLADAPPMLTPQKPLVRTLDIFYMDRSNLMSQARFEKLQQRYPDIQKIRYVNSVMDTIRRCLNRTRSSKFWVIGSENDYTGFDFSWHAPPWQSSMTHVFGSQWNKWSDTFLINRSEFEQHSKWAKDIQEFPNLNFVKDQMVISLVDACDVYMIDHGNAESRQTHDMLQQRHRVIKSSRYFDNYLDTFRRILDGVDTEHIWIVSSVCDYSRFDFSWQPEAWQKDMLHVFASDDQKFGDTFYVPVRALRNKISGLEMLDWFDTVNYVDGISVPRWPLPTLQHAEDSHVEVTKHADFSGPLLLVTVRDSLPRRLPAVNLWSNDKVIVPLDPGSDAVIVPRSAIPSIQTQFYDYPHIDRTQRHILPAQPLDIVFISNGEPNAEENYEILHNHVAHLANRLHRVNGINGRVAAYHAAARVSDTAWFFAVFAKLAVTGDFDWSWQPDRMQQPKHYIFHALNPVNGLVYGHQAMIAYNRSLVLANLGTGLDFTLDSPHETVPMMSGVAVYDTSAWSAWRTAFREAIKLRHSLPDVENQYRLDQWMTQAQGEFGEWSQWGAHDALEYYDKVAGDLNQLRLSYEWSWLASYALVQRNLTPDQ